MEDLKCTMFECGRPPGPDAVEVYHKNERVAILCSECVCRAKTLRVVFKRGEDGKLRAEELMGWG